MDLAPISQKLNQIASQLEALKKGQESLKESISSLRLPPSPSGVSFDDGPVPPDGFHLDKLYDGFTPLEWRLMAYLWTKKAIEEDDVLEAVYGHDHDDKDDALRSVVKRINKKLRQKGFPGRVVSRNGHLAINLFQLNNKANNGS
jgi:hypothetical protein